MELSQPELLLAGDIGAPTDDANLVNAAATFNMVDLPCSSQLTPPFGINTSAPQEFAFDPLTTLATS